MTYGVQIWSINRSGNQTERSKTKELKVTQNRCLRKVTGAYRRALVAAIERESGTPPIDLYMEAVVMQRAVKTAQHPDAGHIDETMAKVWESTKRPMPRIWGEEGRRDSGNASPPGSRRPEVLQGVSSVRWEIVTSLL
ncbi:uncharacterized protein BDR25DRAFT_317187 [Lindgomyces ingoldianus]|uniref:Uncharacterized protein n=1 Tax=Lindgomyces ingoldianus TaxID=673940 RepID=A0ACB6QJ93_9PLEO|nr:uncharacterized protein BDR25DRAFT_317187 [Lindgomyces ingoldianus]KAF2466946.1 hypothetical protein BDR25DRAFT_317187 [Lindgomyces ingoldianus]